MQDNQLMIELLLKALPGITNILTNVHGERQNWEQEKVLLYDKQTEHVQKVQRLEELQENLQKKAQEIFANYTELHEQNAELKADGSERNRRAPGKVEDPQQDRAALSAQEADQRLQTHSSQDQQRIRFLEDEIGTLKATLSACQSDLARFTKEVRRLTKEIARLKREVEVVTEREEDVRDRLILTRQSTSKMEETFACQVRELELKCSELQNSPAVRRQLDEKSQEEAEKDKQAVQDLLGDVRKIHLGSSTVYKMLKQHNDVLRTALGPQTRSFPRLSSTSVSLVHGHGPSNGLVATHGSNLSQANGQQHGVPDLPPISRPLERLNGHRARPALPSTSRDRACLNRAAAPAISRTPLHQLSSPPLMNGYHDGPRQKSSVAWSQTSSQPRGNQEDSLEMDYRTAPIVLPPHSKPGTYISSQT